MDQPTEPVELEMFEFKASYFILEPAEPGPLDPDYED